MIIPGHENEACNSCCPISRSKLLILDEATSGLDPIIRDEILDIFNDFTRDESHSVLLSSHIVSDLEKICDYIAFLHKGKLVFCEEKDRLLEQYSIVRLTKAEFEAIPSDAVKGKKVTDYGVEALIERNSAMKQLKAERTSIEDIILFLAKGEKTHERVANQRFLHIDKTAKNVFTDYRSLFAYAGSSTASFAFVYSAMLPITAMAYDERSKWDKLAAMMPYSKRSIN